MTIDVVDTGHAATRWEFDEEVTRVFDDMLARSIPAYPDMRSLTTRLALEFVRPATCIVDLGTSRGEAIALLDPGAHVSNLFVGIEVSAPMRIAAASRFAQIRNVDIVNVDLRDRAETRNALRNPGLPCSVVLSVLTLQFVPIEHRAQILDDVFDALAPGGAFFLVEKVLGGSGRIADLLTAVYHEGKRAAGYTAQDVERKRLSLEGVLVAQTATTNEAMLRNAGFMSVECYWRWANFAAWLAIRP